MGAVFEWIFIILGIWLLICIFYPIIKTLCSVSLKDDGADLTVREEMEYEYEKNKLAEYEALKKEEKKLRKKGLL